MSVWMCAPSKRPTLIAQGIVNEWEALGYKTAIWRDTGDDPVLCDLLIRGEYPGHYDCANRIVRAVFSHDPKCDWVVCASDDTEPDKTHTPRTIAEQCSAYFEEPGALIEGAEARLWVNATFGVMQPTGDRFANGSIDRICGSPWIGREFARRMYGGRGPWFPEYTHMFGDEELQNVALKLGVLWQRPDLIHLHHHFMRTHEGIDSPAQKIEVPPHLVEANSRQHWDRYRALFNARKEAGFPGHEPIA